MQRWGRIIKYNNGRTSRAGSEVSEKKSHGTQVNKDIYYRKGETRGWDTARSTSSGQYIVYMPAYLAVRHVAAETQGMQARSIPGQSGTYLGYWKLWVGT